MIWSINTNGLHFVNFEKNLGTDGPVETVSSIFHINTALVVMLKFDVFVTK